jgi:SAM-dependent methyltransferase
MKGRIKDESVEIDTGNIAKFFEHRAERYSDVGSVVSMLYQDKNPDLAVARDVFEKEKLLPLLSAGKADRVLDIGCGVGRWAETFLPLGVDYHGTDLVAELIKIAQARFKDQPRFSFQVVASQNARPDTLTKDVPFSIILIAGVLQYMNDGDCRATFENAAMCSAYGTRILIRVPVGTPSRLTLSGIWSAELNHEYSAIYRTASEYVELFDEILRPAGFSVVENSPLYPDALNNRDETRQHFFLLKR